MLSQASADCWLPGKTSSLSICDHSSLQDAYMNSKVGDPKALLAFCGLIFQNAASSLVTKYTRGQGSLTKTTYAPIASIATTEGCKLVASLILELRLRNRRKISSGKKEDLYQISTAKHVRAILYELAVLRRAESIQMCLPVSFSNFPSAFIGVLSSCDTHAS